MQAGGGIGGPGDAAGGSAGPRGAGTWDSALSAEEFVAIKGAGFEPVGQVLGTAVFHIGYTGAWSCPGPWSAPGVTSVRSSWSAPSFGPMVATLYEARRLALARAVAECRELGGDGIVGVKLRIGRFPAGGVEFTALGTAVRAHSRVRPRRPFTSHLSGQDFAKLVHSGWVPTGLVLGIAIATRHDDWRRFGRNTWRLENQEIDGYTWLMNSARRDARRQLALDAGKHGGDGVVLDEIDLNVRENECPAAEGSRDVVVEAVFVGTSIAGFRRSERAAGPGTLTIMRLERER
ncbi:heavy metal-binding domain-containing protein [Yinghuangia seranimata]|uniref:heavy metal-binding domain-containing protein n=1 Tax=Yinghuangia seranimata TaxID=408067 RepID=UPI00248B7653|nr:heavy metal-binding domain-containing protein [Yinghuangia seranimata]MDI2127261.1 heavy metal-binding domain-containing protein [Yinghuangia seranimata]MDI2132206.1 heavy metal-binding domain-containing protein [Yinghuangia seranimata]